MKALFKNQKYLLLLFLLMLTIMVVSFILILVSSSNYEKASNDFAYYNSQWSEAYDKVKGYEEDIEEAEKSLQYPYNYSLTDKEKEKKEDYIDACETLKDMAEADQSYFLHKSNAELKKARKYNAMRIICIITLVLSLIVGTISIIKYSKIED